MSVELDFEQRTLRELDPRAAAEATARGRFVWVDVALDDPDDDHARLHELGLISPEAIARALRPGPADGDGRDAAHLHLAFTDCRAGEDGVELQHIGLVLGERFLLTTHRGPAPLAADLMRHIPGDFAHYARSPGFLLYEVGARLLDSYRAVHARLEERLASLQERVVAANADAVAEIPHLDQEVLAFRRAVIAARDTLSELGGRRSPLVAETTQPFLTAQALALDRLQQDALASREVLSSTLGLHIAANSSRASRALGRLTGITVIFLPMLFAVQLARADLDWGSPWSALWILAVLYAGAVVWYMRRHRLL